MIKFSIIILAFLTAQAFAHVKPDEELLSIPVNDKIGFINLKGQVVIEPQFKEVGNFVDGLAPARKGAFYGYIDRTGTFVIADTFDYARDFSEGFGIVYVDGEPQYIKPDGTNPFDVSFQNIHPFKGGFAKVKTLNGLTPTINRKGEVVYHQEQIIERDFPNRCELVEMPKYFGDGYAILHTKEGYGIVNMKGDTVVPFVYHGIDSTSNPRYIICTIVEAKYRKGVGGFTPRQVKIYDMETHSELSLKVSHCLSESFTNNVFWGCIDSVAGYYSYQGKLIWGYRPDTIKFPSYTPYIYTEEYSNVLLFFKGDSIRSLVKKDSVFDLLGDTIIIASNGVYLIPKIDHKGSRLRVFLINTSEHPFRAFSYIQDIIPLLQAKDKHGNWQYIQYFSKGGFCANGIGYKRIPPQSYCVLESRMYEGDFKTKLRLVLKGADREELLTSSEFDGTVNPGQWCKKDDDDDN